MTELRAEIDRIDADLVALLTRRAGYIDRAAQIKRDVGLPARIEARVAEVIGNARDRAAASGLDPDLVEDLWIRIVEWSIARETTLLEPKERDG